MEAGFTITKQGWHLLAKLLAGDKLEISKIMVGSGKVPEGVNPGEITELVRPVALATSTVPQVEDKQVSFIVEYRNDLNGGLAEGFWLNEFGVYANDPDNGEILLYYATMGDYPQYVAAYNGQAVDVRRYPVVIALSECYNVELKPPAGAWVTFEELAETLKRRGYHINPNLLINGDFRKPVNRNGKSEYTDAGYTIDRWETQGILTLEANNIKLSSTVNGYIQQVFEESYFKIEQQYTLSILVEELTGSASMTTYDGIVKPLAVGLNILTFNAISSSYKGIIPIYQLNGTIKAIAVKLELGDQQTLAHKDADGNWVPNDPPDYDLQYLLCSQYSPSTGEFVGSQHSNPNLLDNAYWADKDYIINQRGQTEYTDTGYTIDRWKNSLIDKVEIFEDYISLSVSNTSNAYANWGQLLPFNFKELGLITLSVMYKNSSQTSTIAIYDAKGTWKASTDMSASTVWNIVSLTISDNSPEAIRAQLYPTVAGQALAGTLEIRAMKLELGPVQTLAHKDENGNWILNDPPPNKVLELAKCQRYFERLYLPRGFILFNNKTNSLVANLFYTPKRTTPTITAQSMYVVRASDNTGVYGPFVFTTPEFIDSPSKNGCVMNFGDAQVNTIGVGSTAYIADESYIDISADL